MKGFTLIETTIYIGLFAIIIGGLTIAAYSFFDMSGRNQYKAVLQNEQDFLVAKLDMFMSTSSALTVSGNTLTDASGDSLLVGNGFMFWNGVRLNATGTTVSKFSVIRATVIGSAPEPIEAGFTISMKAPNGSTISQSASTTWYVRK